MCLVLKGMGNVDLNIFVDFVLYVLGKQIGNLIPFFWYEVMCLFLKGMVIFDFFCILCLEKKTHHLKTF